MKRISPVRLRAVRLLGGAVMCIALILTLSTSIFAAVPNWAPNTAYSVGSLVMFNGVEYQCIQAHTSQVDWEPPVVPALWQPVSGGGGGNGGGGGATPTPTPKGTPRPTATPTPKPGGGGGGGAAPIPTGADASFTLDSLTFYGNFDNSPPGIAIAHPVIHSGAGGKGTFTDPITFAVAPQVQNVVPPGTILYVPSLQKYFIMEDDCTSSGPGGVAVQGIGCDGELAAGVNEFDLWIGATNKGDNPGGKATNSQMSNCEDQLTSSNVEVIMNATAGKPVNTTPLLNKGKCI